MTTPLETQRSITLERVWDAPLDMVWELWTTKDGIESWWGPEGFSVTVHALDLRPEGVLDYSMTAHGTDQIAFLERRNQPLSTRHQATYTEVVPLQRLAYYHTVDFVPDAEPYQVNHLVQLFETPEGVRMVLTFDAMHNAEWTNLARQGWESEFRKLAQTMAERSKGGGAV